MDQDIAMEDVYHSTWYADMNSYTPVGVYKRDDIEVIHKRKSINYNHLYNSTILLYLINYIYHQNIFLK